MQAALSENLHRSDPSKLERDEQVAEWIRITERVSAQVAAKPQGGRPEGGVRAASRELGIDEDDGHRAKQFPELRPGEPRTPKTCDRLIWVAVQQTARFAGGDL